METCYLEEGVVRARLTDVQIARKARVLDLDMRDPLSWYILFVLTGEI